MPAGKANAAAASGASPEAGAGAARLALQSNERVLLSAAASYKKKPGTLFLTSTRLAFAFPGAPSPTPPAVSVPCADFQTQHVSTAQAKKVMLKLVVSSPAVSGTAAAGTADYTFTFTNTTRAAADREAFKNAIADVLARVKAKAASASPASLRPGSAAPVPLQAANAAGTGEPRMRPLPAAVSCGAVPTSEELKVRKSLLSKYKEIAELHQNLVMANILTEEEFWQTRGDLLRSHVAQERQTRGPSSAWVDLKPVTNEGQNVKYTLTPQLIHEIFLQHSAIKAAYDKNVPDKLSEVEFWTRYFKSRFFRRGASSSVKAAEKRDDIFDAAYEQEEFEVASAPKRIKTDHISKLIDLSTTAEDHDTEFGNLPDFTMKPGSVAHSLPLIRKFNMHAERVLRTSGTDQAKRITSQYPVDEKEQRRQLYERSVVIDDLQEPEKLSVVPLDIVDPTGYFATKTDPAKGPETVARAEDVLQHLRSTFRNAELRIDEEFIRSSATQYVMDQLNLAIRRKNAASESGGYARRLSPQQLAQVSACHAQANEILRHFWASFPPNQPEKAAKAARMVERVKVVREGIETAKNGQADRADAEQMDVILRPLHIALQKCLEEYRER